jgi:DNA-binding SARP family transcriptional activator
MEILQVTLLGRVRITHDNWRTEVTMTREIQALLAYLLVHRNKIHSRETIAGVFWGERSQEKARGSLNTALWRLKKALEPDEVLAGRYLVNSHQGSVSFNRESQYWLDIETFETTINQSLISDFQRVEQHCVSNLENVLTFYNGDFLEGFYMDWILRERERLRTLYLKSLAYLLKYYQFHKCYEKAISYGQQILYLEPLREEIHRDVMRLYSENGQRVLAMQQYEICRSLLDRELNILPMKDTQELYLQTAKTQPGSVPTWPFQERIGYDQIIQQLKEAKLTIDLAKEKIEEAFQLISKYSPHHD